LAHFWPLLDQRDRIKKPNFPYMTVANANAFLDQLKKGSPTPELMAKIGTDFTKEHVSQALKERGTSKDDLLKHASGGSATTDWIGAGAACAGAAASGA
jgi:hypothetical protein